MAVSEVNRPPVSCIPSPESPANRITTESSCSTGFEATDEFYTRRKGTCARDCPWNMALGSPLRIELETQRGEVVEQEVRERQREREEECDRDRLLVGKGVTGDRVQDPRQDARVLERIPAVQPQDPPEIDPERAEADGEDREDPARDRAAPLPYDRLHQVERREAEQHAEPRKRGNRDRVVPVRRQRVVLQMHEVRGDVRRVREEEQPEPSEDQQQRPAAPATPAVVDEDREQERNPGEKEVPDQVAGVAVPRVDVAHDDERDAEERRDEQAGDREDPAATRLHSRTGHSASARSARKSSGSETIDMLPSSARGHSSSGRSR